MVIKSCQVSVILLIFRKFNRSNFNTLGNHQPGFSFWIVYDSAESATKTFEQAMVKKLMECGLGIKESTVLKGRGTNLFSSKIFKMAIFQTKRDKRFKILEKVFDFDQAFSDG